MTTVTTPAPVDPKLPRQARRHPDRYYRQTTGFRLPVYANLSRRHPDYGMTPKEHAVAKEKRK